uniref:Uncharacterized protein n=1 Tax=Arundo donax TaxID=35708 RepID=A0A0A8Y957_ARUDO
MIASHMNILHRKGAQERHIRLHGSNPMLPVKKRRYAD